MDLISQKQKVNHIYNKLGRDFQNEINLYLMVFKRGKQLMKCSFSLPRLFRFDLLKIISNLVKFSKIPDFLPLKKVKRHLHTSSSFHFPKVVD